MYHVNIKLTAEKNNSLTFFPQTKENLHQISVLIRLTYLIEARTRPDRTSFCEMMDQYLIVLRFVNEDMETNFPIIGQSFVIESLKMMRYEVCKDDNQVILAILLDLFDNYASYLRKIGFKKFSKELIDPKVNMLLEILDCSKCFSIMY